MDQAPMNSGTLNSAAAETDDLKNRLGQYLGDDLTVVNQILNRQLRSPSRFVSDITEHVSRFRGKQIRPILLLLFNGLLGGQGREKARTLGAVVELIHTATLVHDDVIDDADTRRHVTTVQRRWNTETSILLGDFLFSRSFHLAASTGDAEACRLIGLATDRTCEGELNQVAARLEQSTSELDYFRVIRDKTGQLFALSGLLGARCAEVSESSERACRMIALRLGLAFQIADDVLDLTQSHQTTGKDEANDLQNGRLTLPLLRTLQLSDESERAIVLEALSSGCHESFARLTEMAVFQQGIESAAKTAEQLCQRATAGLNRFAPCEERNLLQAVITFAGRRQH
jgi:octaprenyl-diphosphate synthase